MGKVVKMNKADREAKQAEARKKKRAKARNFIIASTLIALFVSALLWIFELRWYIFIIPIILHVFLMFYTFAVQFYKERKKMQVWAAYVKKYGKNGVIPEHIKMIHKKLIKSGKKITI